MNACTHAWQLCHVRKAWVCVHCRAQSAVSARTLQQNAVLLTAAGRGWQTKVAV